MKTRVPGSIALAFSLLACTARSDKRPLRHIDYWEKWTGFEGSALDAVIDDFNVREAAHGRDDPSYVPIEVERVTVSNLEQKLLIAIAGGTPPDLAGNYSFFVPAYAENGALTDLDPLLRETHFDASRYIEHYLDLGRYRGTTWAVPIVPASIALVWNKQLFREAGIDPEQAPRTIEQLDALAERLTKWEVTLPDGRKELASGYLPHVPASRKRLVQAGFLPSEPGFWSYGWGYFFGGRLLEGSQVTAADTDNVVAYEWLAAYSKKLGVGVAKRFRSGFGSSSSPQNAFLSGKLAMMLQGVWIHNFIERYAPGLDWGAASFPYPEGRPQLANTTDAEADVLVIPRGSRHPREAFAFLRYLTEQAPLEKLCLGQQKYTPLAAVSDEFWRMHPNPYIRLFRDLGTSENAFAIPQTGVWNEYQRELTNAVDLIQNLTEPPRQALSEVQGKVQAALDRKERVLTRRELAR